MNIAPKHLIMAAGLIAALGLSPALSATVNQEQEVGFIDMRRIAADAKAVRTMQEELKAAEENLKAEFEKRKKQLADAVKKNMPAAEQEKLRQQLQEEMGPLQEKAQQLSQELSERFKKQLEAAVKKVAGDRKLNLVLDKEVIHFGGKDITEDVVKTLNG